MRGNFTDIRRQLVALAASKKTRAVPFSAEMPCRWHPATVTNPQTGELFTEAGAWEFIIDLLDAGEPLEEIELRKPPGRTGYVIKLTAQGASTIYIKLQLGSGRVFGRSFHYSNTQEHNDE